MNIIFLAYFIFITIVSFYRKYILAGILCFISVCHLTIISLQSRPSMPPFIISGLISIFFVLCVFLIYQYNKSLQDSLDSANRDLRKFEEQLSLLRDKDRTLLDRNNQLERSLNEIVTVYEYVKKLGSTMDFTEAVGILEDAMRSLVQFGGGKLFVLEGDIISKVYTINDKEAKKNMDLSLIKEYEKNIVSRVIRNSQMFIYEKRKLTDMGHFPKEVETLIAMPLIVEKQLVAVITLENLQLVNMEKINFITLQFAMEVKKAQLYEKVKELSKIDGLTQLYLRRHFMGLLANELDRGNRQGQSLSFLMLDIDYFKKYNDEYGHLIGDLILKKVADILKEKSREIDLLCRYGGDEFALVLPRTSAQDANIVAERLRRAVGEHLFQVAKEKFQVTISVGIANCDPKEMCRGGIADVLIDLADKALYQAKSLGRNKAIFSVS